VLIVDNDVDLRRMYRTALALAGFDVDEASGGIEALRMLDSHLPDLIVLDPMLPDISGAVLRQEVAAHAHTRHIPVVVVTEAEIDPAALAVPCVLRKPVSPEQLVAAVRTCLSSGAAGGV
jgi:DNA-binding response OmpR family regulator